MNGCDRADQMIKKVFEEAVFVDFGGDASQRSHLICPEQARSTKKNLLFHLQRLPCGTA